MISFDSVLLAKHRGGMLGEKNSAQDDMKTDDVLKTSRI